MGVVGAWDWGAGGWANAQLRRALNLRRRRGSTRAAQQAKCPRVLCVPLVCGARALWGPRSGRDGAGRGISAAHAPPAAAAAAARRPRRRRHSACVWPGRRRRCCHNLRGRAGRSRSARARWRPGAPPDSRGPPGKAVLPPPSQRTAVYSRVQPTGTGYGTVGLKSLRFLTKGCSLLSLSRTSIFGWRFNTQAIVWWCF